jgi:hypothetical protein
MYLEEKKTGEALMRDVLEWVKARDPKEVYQWSSNDSCACAQYAREKGLTVDWLSRDHGVLPFLRVGAKGDETWRRLSALAYDQTCSDTMGAFASRLERALS